MCDLVTAGFQRGRRISFFLGPLTALPSAVGPSLAFTAGFFGPDKLVLVLRRKVQDRLKKRPAIPRVSLQMRPPQKPFGAKYFPVSTRKNASRARRALGPTCAADAHHHFWRGVARKIGRVSNPTAWRSSIQHSRSFIRPPSDKDEP